VRYRNTINLSDSNVKFRSRKGTNFCICSFSHSSREMLFRDGNWQWNNQRQSPFISRKGTSAILKVIITRLGTLEVQFLQHISGPVRFAEGPGRQTSYSSCKDQVARHCLLSFNSLLGDHALIDISKIVSMNPRHVTVRTKSKENHSSDSNATAIPAAAIKGKHSSKVNTSRAKKRRHSKLSVESSSNAISS